MSVTNPVTSPVTPEPLPPLRILRTSGHTREQGPEDVVVDTEGQVWTGTGDGRILRVDLSAGRIEEVARTGGRPLGLELLPDDTLLVADAERGILRVAGGKSEVLAERAGGQALGQCSNVCAAPDGSVYFTVSTRRHSLAEWRSDILEHVGSGRLLRLGPDDHEPEVVLDGLQFANGVALSPDGSYAVVCETGARRLLKVALEGPRAGASEVFADGLPGYPDNLSRAADGTFWTALAQPREGALELVHRMPGRVREGLGRATRRVRTVPRRTVRVLALDGRGQVVRDLARAGAGYRMPTSAAVHGDRLVLGSLWEPGIAWCALPGR
ncbi:SMP-30/gluconolactonase/LRE family protein [Streptomyces sp. NPDC001941]|uniref:SMP-30/gluconolactonase/LRE family protein n=1 Tax=Streptomyces sp. NPDC001941 TaxID=3154659 RepID=UPI00332CA021